MSHVARPDGARLEYTVRGNGRPVLYLPPAAEAHDIDGAAEGLLPPLRAFADGLPVMTLGQREAGRSQAPLAPFSYDAATADALAALDAAGVADVVVLAAGAGSARTWRLVRDAPARVRAAVLVEPAGLDSTNAPADFYASLHETMRLARADGMAAVVAAAQRSPGSDENPGAGPFARRIQADAPFRARLRALPVESYVALIVRFRDGVWPAQPPFFSVSAEWMAGCPAPLLVLPGNDARHPPGVARLICEFAPNARRLDDDWRHQDKLPAAVSAVRAFLAEHGVG